MNLKTQKMMASRILKAGLSRVRVENDPDVSEAITRNDVKELIKGGLISTVPKKGVCSAPRKIRAAQKGKGRMSAGGSKKGTKKARKTPKTKWIEKIRPIRKMLRDMKDAKQLENSDYRKLYRLASGGSFRSRKHVLMFIKDHDMLKAPKPKKTAKKKEEPAKKAKAKKTKTTKPARKAGPEKTDAKTAGKTADKKVKKDA